ncbi:hypothetical protein EDC94DRAFT_523699, partial [Helicostylum pulchrum]
GNHPKKSGEKKETNSKQQQRKNSAGKKENATKSLLNNQKAQAAGAAILSAVTSPQTSQQQQQQQQQALGANGFNRGELVEFLNMRFSDALTAYHDTNLDPSMRPETYESSKPVNAWAKNTNGVPSAWGQQQKEKGTNTHKKKKRLYLKEIIFY